MIAQARADDDPATHVERALEGLRKRIADFDRIERGYPSRPFVQWLDWEGDYDHLARVREWSTITGEES